MRHNINNIFKVFLRISCKILRREVKKAVNGGYLFHHVFHSGVIFWVILGLKLMAANQLSMNSLYDYGVCVIICKLNILIKEYL